MPADKLRVEPPVIPGTWVQRESMLETVDRVLKAHLEERQNECRKFAARFNHLTYKQGVIAGLTMARTIVEEEIGKLKNM